MTDEKTAGIDRSNSIEALNDLSQEEIVHFLAQQPPLTREELSRKICKARGWTLNTLREEISKASIGEDDHDCDAFIEKLAPAEEPVSGHNLAATVQDLFQHHVKAGDHDYTVLTLWVFLTYCYDDFEILPKLLINSPQKRCGKSTLLELLEAAVYRGILASGISAASIYRIVDLYKPCLLLDEADTYMKQDEHMRGIVNAGHKKRSANIYRCVGDDPTPKRFSTWSPMAIAGIGNQASTVMDRSIVINMRRKLFNELVSKVPKRFYETQRLLRKQLLRWAEDHHDRIQAAYPTIPPSNNDRASDNWYPLLCIAEVIGGEWLNKVLEALKAASEYDSDEDAAIMLLGDLRDIFRDSGTDRIHTTDIVHELVKKEGRPWPEWKNGFPITPTALSKILQPFNVRPRQMKIQGKNLNGYSLQSLEDVFERYLPPVLSSTPLPASDPNGLGVEFEKSKLPTSDLNLYPSTPEKSRQVDTSVRGVDTEETALPTRKLNKHNGGRGVEPQVPPQTETKDAPAQSGITREIDTSHLKKVG